MLLVVLSSTSVSFSANYASCGTKRRLKPLDPANTGGFGDLLACEAFTLFVYRSMVIHGPSSRAFCCVLGDLLQALSTNGERIPRLLSESAGTKTRSACSGSQLCVGWSWYSARTTALQPPWCLSYCTQTNDSTAQVRRAVVYAARLVVDVLNRLRYCALTKATRTEIGEQRARWLRSQIEDADDEAYCRTLAFRKTVEIATQVPNAYLYSTLVARPWINHTKVALVVVNCWSAFITHKILMKRNRDTSPNPRQTIRYFAVVVDALLATATAILLPSVIFMPYALQFDLRDLTFPSSLLYGDAEFPNLVLENRAFFFMSWANAAMKLVPHVSVVLCLEGIASMLHASYHSDLANNDAITSVHAIEPTHKQHIVATGSDRALTPGPSSTARSSKRLYRVIHVLTPLLFLTTGGIILFVHLTAQYGDIKGDIDFMEGMCVYRMHPWFASNFSCATVKFNCYREGVVSPTQESLSALEREAVRKIIFMHCSAFSMPPIIREFSFIMGIESWNTTLVAWGEESAISAQLHNTLLFVNFAYVNMTGIPAGLLQTPLPQRLTDLEFTHTNLTGLPDEIAKSWIDVEIVFIEHSLINPFPSVLMQLPMLSELSLIDNKFNSIPNDALANAASTYFYNLALSHNALRELPQARAEKIDVTYMALEFTLLTEVPAWVYTNVWDSVSLGGSPLCEANSTAELPEFARCGTNDRAWDPLGTERFPTDLIKPFRTLNG